MKRSPALLVALTALSLAASLLGGCDGPSVEFHASDKAYSSPQTRLVLERIDASGLSDRPTQKADALRTSALADLRSQGKAASEAADLITSTFPPKTKSVPVYVERATVDGKSSFIIIEAWGPAEGKLDSKRLWVIARGTGDVIYSAATK